MLESSILWQLLEPIVARWFWEFPTTQMVVVWWWFFNIREALKPQNSSNCPKTFRCSTICSFNLPQTIYLIYSICYNLFCCNLLCYLYILLYDTVTNSDTFNHSSLEGDDLIFGLNTVFSLLSCAPKRATNLTGVTRRLRLESKTSQRHAH